MEMERESLTSNSLQQELGFDQSSCTPLYETSNTSRSSTDHLLPTSLLQVYIISRKTVKEGVKELSTHYKAK